MKITRRKLRDLILQEEMIKAGQIRFNLDVDKLANKGYSGKALPSGPNPTAAQMSALRGAMILRAVIESTANTKDIITNVATSSLIASIGESIAAALLGGVQFNSSWLGGDNAVFADVKVGDTFWSVKLQAKGKVSNPGRSAASLPKTKLASLYQATQVYGTNKFGSMILVFEEGGIKIFKTSSKIFKEEDFKENGKSLTYYDPATNSAYNNTELTSPSALRTVFGDVEEIQYEVASEDEIIKSLMSFDPGGPMMGSSSWETMNFDNQAIDTYENFRLNEIEDMRRLQTTSTGPRRFEIAYRGTAESWQQFKKIIGSPNISASEIIKLFPFFGKGLGAASQRSDRFISSAGKFMSGEDASGSRRNFVYKSSRLFELMSQVMDSYAENPMTDAQLNTIIDKIDALVNDLNTLNSET